MNTYAKFHESPQCNSLKIIPKYTEHKLCSLHLAQQYNHELYVLIAELPGECLDRMCKMPLCSIYSRKQYGCLEER